MLISSKEKIVNQAFKVLVAEDEEMIASLYEMILTSEFDCQITLAKDGLEAAEILTKDSDYHMVITDYTMPKKNGVALYHEVIKPKKIPTLFITGNFRFDLPDLENFETDHPLNSFVLKPFVTNELVALIDLIYQDFKKSAPKISPPPATTLEAILRDNHLTSLPINILKRYGFDSIDVHVKLHQDRLTKIIAKENSFSLDQKTLEEYIAKGVSEVYIQKDAFMTITKHMINQLTIKARQLKKVSPLDIAGLQVNVSLHNLKELGINDEQINSVNEILEETIQSIFVDKTIENKIKELMKGYSYHTSHCVLLMYVASNILKKTTLPFQKTLKKIALAAFFHDLSIDNETAEHELRGLDPKSEPASMLKKRLLEHPRASTELLKRADDDTFNEAKKIIEEHHETPNGKGYPRGLNASQISPLSALFILSHEIANNLYRNEYNKDILAQMLKNFEKDYNQGNFKNFFEAARKAFLQL